MPLLCKRLVIVGVGLIGGSIALAARSRGVAAEVIGVGRRRESVDRALASGVVESATTDLGEAASTADVVVVCTPVGSVAPTLAAAAAACPPGSLLTDAGSTKRAIVEQAEGLLAGIEAAPAFVGSHPLAGDHRTGPESARGDLLEGRIVVVTPTAQTGEGAEDRVNDFWRALGAKPVTMSPAAHDAAVACTSHLPHLVAAALAAATPDDILPLAGSGWADTTRVAAGSAELWREIFLANRVEVLAALTPFEHRLVELRNAIADADGARIEELLKQGRDRREALGD